MLESNSIVSFQFFLFITLISFLNHSIYRIPFILSSQVFCNLFSVNLFNMFTIYVCNAIHFCRCILHGLVAHKWHINQMMVWDTVKPLNIGKPSLLFVWSFDIFIQIYLWITEKLPLSNGKSAFYSPVMDEL